ALRALRLWPRLAGFRGQPGSDHAVLGHIVRAIADAYLAEASSIAEIEINPMRVVVDADQTSYVALDIVALRR
ncbi:MAG TPA: hypothetical protein VNO54_23525, partial [Streptosporangiaceae bacterium]|nr:hypothetical protein [Streptosporangiaceae bacterium]